MREDENQLVGEVDRWVTANEDAIVRTLQALVRSESETHPPGGNEGPVQALVEKEMRSLGLEVDVFEPTEVPGITEHPGWWPGLDFTNRPNVVGKLVGHGEGRSLILNGHADVVPAGDHAEWKHPPYAAEIEDRKVFGRGAVDMKGGLAAILAAVRCLLEIGASPAGDLILESVVNEELGGYNGTLACIAKGYGADAAVITEATDFQIAVATKGGQVYCAVVPGRPTHSCWWSDGISALDKAIAFKAALEEFEAERARETRSNPYFSDPILHPKSAYVDTIWSLRAGDPELMAHPADAELYFWVDHLPGEDREQLLRRFEAYVDDFCRRDAWLAEHPIQLERSAMRPFVGVGVDLEHEVIRSLARVHRLVRHDDAIVTGLPAASDTMMFNLYSATPAVNFGGGNIVRGRAHAPDEYIGIDSLLDTVRTVALLIADYCGVVRQQPAKPEATLV